MKTLSNLRISSRLTLGFAVVLLLATASTSIALISGNRNAAATREMMEKPLAKERLIADWYVLIYSAIARTSMIARSTDEKLATTFAGHRKNEGHFGEFEYAGRTGLVRQYRRFAQ